jgi:preprotein translocase subunit SecE
MKLSEKKDESATKKVQSIDTARKAVAKSASAKPASKPRKAEAAKKPVKKTGASSLAWVETARQYLREVVYELRKVVWPSRKETLGSTAVVLVIVGISAVFLGFVDLVLSRLVRLLVG